MKNEKDSCTSPGAHSFEDVHIIPGKFKSNLKKL